MIQKRSSFQNGVQQAKPHIKKQPQVSSKPQVSINKFAVLARAVAIIKSDPKKYKGLLSHAQNQFKNYAREIENSGLYTREELRQVYSEAKSSDNPRLTGRASRQIERYEFRKKAINFGLGAATTLVVGVSAISQLFGGTTEVGELITTPPAQVQQSEVNEHEAELELEFEYEAQPELSADEFTQNYRNESRQQSQNALETVQFMEGADDYYGSGHQTVSRVDGMSFGKIQYNFAPGAETANELLQKFFTKHPDSALEVFGETDLNILKNMLKKDPTSIQTKIAKDFDYWEPIFKDKLLVHPVFVALMDDNIERRTNQAHTLCDKYGLTSALALEYALNANVRNGNNGADTKFSLLKAFDREQITPEIAYVYFETKFGTIPEKMTMIRSLSEDGLIDYFFLNQIADANPGDTRGAAILGTDGKTKDGLYEHGANAHPGKWFTTDLGKLEETRKPETENGLMQALYDAGYIIDGVIQEKPVQTTVPQNDKSQ